MLVLKGGVFMALLGICYQDFRFRAVYWWLFPILFTVLSVLAGKELDFATLIKQGICNTMFLMLQIFFLSLYFSLKEKRLVNIFKGYFGLGDLLFLLSIILYLSFFNYVLFYMISLFVVIMLTVLARLVVARPNPKIPLAGYQSFLLVILMVVAEMNGKISLISDVWLINYLGL